MIRSTGIADAILAATAIPALAQVGNPVAPNQRSAGKIDAVFRNVRFVLRKVPLDLSPYASIQRRPCALIFSRVSKRWSCEPLLKTHRRGASRMHSLSKRKVSGVPKERYSLYGSRESC